MPGNNRRRFITMSFIFTAFVLTAFAACSGDPDDSNPNSSGNKISTPSGGSGSSSSPSGGGSSAGSAIGLADVTTHDMVPIASGNFLMGGSYTVTLTKDFYMGKYQVTQELYQAVTGSNPGYFSAANGRAPAEGEAADKRPAEQVSWYDAVAFCNALSVLEGLTSVYTINGTDVSANWNANGYRLPTEAEWEYACRAGTTTAYNTGAGVSDATGWYAGNSKNTTHETGLKSANAWGLYDTHGNVYEWCWDWWAPFADKDEMDSTGPASSPIKRRVMRGAAWKSPSTLIRSAYRDYGDPFHKCTADGFRLVRSAQNAQ